MSTAHEDPCFVSVFADESCIGNGREGDNPGGAGALIELRGPSSGAIVRRDLWISEPATTNNRMALQVGDRVDARARREGRGLPRHVHDRLAVHRGRHDAVGALVGAAGVEAEGRRGREPRTLARGDPAPPGRTPCRGSGCAATTVTRRTSTRTISRPAPPRTQTHSGGSCLRSSSAWLAAARAKGAQARGSRAPSRTPGAFRASPPLPSPAR